MLNAVVVDSLFRVSGTSDRSCCHYWLYCKYGLEDAAATSGGPRARLKYITIRREENALQHI